MTGAGLESFEREASLRDRIFEGSGRGAEDLRESLSEWRLSKEDALRRLGALPLDLAEEVVEEEIRRIARRVEALEEGGPAAPDAQVRRVLELGERVRWCLRLAGELSPKEAGDASAFLEEEVGWVRRAAADLGRLGGPAEEGAKGLLAAADRVQAAVVQEKLDRFLAGAAHEEASAGRLEEASRAWSAVSASFQIEGEIAALGAAASGAIPASSLEALRERRERLVRACAGAVSAAGPVEVAEFVRRVVAELSDQHSAVAAERGSGGLSQEVSVLRLLSGRIEAFLRVVEGARCRLARGAPAGSEEARALRRDLGRLASLRRRSRVSTLEAETNLRIERALGTRTVRWFENFLFLCIAAFLALVFVEWHLPEGSPHIRTVHAADTVLCALFQIDFFLRWAFARWGGWFFWRHFFLESLPALPYGLIFHHLSRAWELPAIEEARAVIVVRLLRSRSILLFVARAARVFRVVLFCVRGADRSVERLRGVLDRDIVLFEPDAPVEDSRARAKRELLALEARRQKLARHLFGEVSWNDRPSVLGWHAGLLDLEARASPGRPDLAAGTAPRAPGEIHLENVIDAFLECDAATVTSLLGHEGTQRAARLLRLLDVPLVRDAPVIRGLVAAGRTADPPEAVAGAARSLGEALERLLGALKFWGDLSGISTGPQVLDRIAATIVVATRRPAVRLLLFGSLFLLAKLFFLALSSLFNVELSFFKTLFAVLLRILGLPLLILGSVCLVLLLTGRWFKKIAGEALDVYLRTADAHAYPLLKSWKLSRLEKDLRRLHRSVFSPEIELRSPEGASSDDWLAFLSEGVLRAGAGPSRFEDDARFVEFLEARQLVCLLYRSFLDGPILHRLDDRISVELLANLAVQEVRVQTLRLRKKDLRRLERLDLGKDRILTLGPYFWFRFITESLAIETAKLVMEYNACCIPISERQLASPEAMARFEEFLSVRRGRQGRAAEKRAKSAADRVGQPLCTQHFSALEFLDVDPERDRAVRRIFGDQVLDALRSDRRWLIREVFGTRPYHLLPRSQRTLNPYRLYRRHLAGLRVFAFPVAVVGKLSYAGARQLYRLVKEVLGAEPDPGRQLPRTAGFDVAVRKINRMRKPFFMEALRLRAAVDIEYLGLRLPGFEREECGPSVEEDLDFIGASRAERRPLEQAKAQALRDLRRFRAFLEERGLLSAGMETLLGTLDPSGLLWKHRGEVVRALVTAFVTDHASMRTRLTAPESVRRRIEEAIDERKPLARRIGGLCSAAIRSSFPSGRRRRALLREYLEASTEFRELPSRLRRKISCAFLNAPAETEEILSLALDRLRSGGAEADGVLEQLRRVALEYPSWTRRILSVRALQAVAVLDVESYRDLVYALGQYE